MISITRTWAIAAAIFSFTFSASMFANTKAELQNLVPQIKSIANDPAVIRAADAANQAHAKLSKTDIRNLSREWHAGIAGKSSDVLTEVNNSNLSTHLKDIQAQKPDTYASILVMDAKGLVLGQTYNTPHYSQASQPVWRKINQEGASAVYFGKVKKTDAGDLASIGVPVVANQQVIGAVLVQVKVPATTKTPTTK